MWGKANAGSQVLQRLWRHGGTIPGRIPRKIAQRSMSVGKLLMWVGMGSLVLLIPDLVVAGFVVKSAGIAGRGIDRSGKGDQYVEGIGVQHDILPTQNHIPQNETVNYSSIPATSGDHWRQPPRPAISWRANRV